MCSARMSSAALAGFALLRQGVWGPVGPWVSRGASRCGHAGDAAPTRHAHRQESHPAVALDIHREAARPVSIHSGSTAAKQWLSPPHLERGDRDTRRKKNETTMRKKCQANDC